ncbi:MAG TPA: M23 family metallopeptidase, partial [Azospirillaceae bacterium]|nr:M23 family metallopeptidase [Azospirillaceae bacterium]
SVDRQGEDGFGAEENEKKVERALVAATGTIRTSLYEAGVSAGVPVPLMMALIRAYSYDVDFQRDPQPGDTFAILFERYVTGDGAIARDGDLLYAELTLTGKVKPIYRQALRGGKVDYFNRQGESVRKALLRTPMDGAKLTSSFGMRRHPILGYSKMHKGADFGAPTGTPIFAAGNGVIEEAGPKGAYGNYIRVRHNAEISTAYAHMSRFARGTQRGVRVDQGDVIGYVGSTGRSTGAHLHYEVLKGNQQVNPMSVNLPIGKRLEGKELAAFQKTVRELDLEFARARPDRQVAEKAGAKGETVCGAKATC